MEKSQSIKNIAAALLKFDAEVSTVNKGETNPFFKNKYAALPDILSAIKEPLIKAGLTVKQFPTGEHEMTTIVIHAESGEYLESTYKMIPAKNDPQGEGSRITYQRRYALGAALGLNIDEDDDGNKASQNHTQKQPLKSDANPSGLTGSKPAITDQLLKAAIQRALNGEPDVYERMMAAFTLTTSQVTEFQLAMQKGL